MARSRAARDGNTTQSSPSACYRPTTGKSGHRTSSNSCARSKINRLANGLVQIHRASYSESRRHHPRRPALDECSEAVERLGEIVSGGSKAQAEMRGRIEAVAGSEQDSTLGGGLAER